MAAYLTNGRTLHLDFSNEMVEILTYAVQNKITLNLWPAGPIVPTAIEIVSQEIDATTFSDFSPVYVIGCKEIVVRW